jgi:hypothetical protein
MAGEYDDTEDTGYSGMPGLAVMSMGNQFTTPEAQEYAKKYLNQMEATTKGEEVDQYMARIRAQNEAAKKALQEARARLQAKKPDKASLWLAASAGFGAPTKFGTLGESAANFSNAIAQPWKQYQSEADAKQKGISDIDLLLAHTDDPELAAKLQIMKMRQDLQSRMGVKALDILGRPLQSAAPNKSQITAIGAGDRAYAPLYAEYVTGGGAANAVKGLDDLNTAQEMLMGRVDPKTGRRLKAIVPEHIDPKSGKKIPAKYEQPDNLSGWFVGSIGKIPFGVGDWAQSVFAPGAANVRQLVEYTVQNSLRPILGSQFTEYEGERLIARVYNPLFDEQTNARRVAILRQTLQRVKAQKDAAAHYWEEHHTLGPTPEDRRGFQGRYNWDNAKVEDLLPMGSLPGDDKLPPVPVGATAPRQQRANPGQVDDIPIEALQTPPAQARGGRVRFDEGGVARSRRPRAWTQREWDTGLIPPNPGEGPDDSGSESSMNQLRERQLLKRAGSQLTEKERQMIERRSKFGRGGYAQGGGADDRVETLPDGRERFKMPDGQGITAPAGKYTYDQALEIYTKANGRAPTIPGIPPQEIPALDEGDQPQEVPPQAAPQPAINVGQQPGAQPIADVDPTAGVVQDDQQSDGPTAMDLAGSGIGHGLLGAAGGWGASKVSHGAMNLVPGNKVTRGEGRVLSALENEALSPTDWAKHVARAHRLGVPMNALDAGGIEMRALGNQAMNPANKVTRDFYQDLKARQAAASGRVEDQVNKALKPDPYLATLDKLGKELKVRGGPEYEKLWQKYPSVKSPELFQLMETPTGKKAVDKAMEAMKDRGESLGKVDALGMVRKPTLRFLDEVKDSLDDMIQKEEMKNGVFQKTKKGNRMREMRRTYRDALDRATTDPKTGVSDYQQVRQNYGGDLEVMDALRFGREDFGKTAPDELEKYVKDMSFSEKDALRSGVAQHLFDQLGKTSGKSNPAATLINTPAQLDKLKVVFDKPKEFEVLKAALEAEARIYEDSASTIRKGQSNIMSMKSPTENIARRTAKAMPFKWWRPSAWALKYLRSTESMKPAEADAIIKMLKTNDPVEMKNMAMRLERKVGRPASRKRWTRAGMIAGAAAEAGRTIYNKLNEAPPQFEEEEAPPEEEQQFAKGGLVRKPQWMKDAEVSLNLTMYGGDDLVSDLMYR